MPNPEQDAPGAADQKPSHPAVTKTAGAFISVATTLLLAYGVYKILGMEAKDGTQNIRRD